MPSKSRSKMARFERKGAYLRRSYSTTTRWDPFCNRDEETYSGTSTQSLQGNEEGTEYAVESEHIRYANSGRKAYNNCDHLQTRLEVENNGTLVLEYLFHDTENRGFVSCDPEDFTFREVTDERYLSISGLEFAASVGLGIVDASLFDPYLPLGTALLSQKLADLDKMALDTMIPELDSGFSMPQFLFELMELKQLFKQAARLLGDLPDVVRALFHQPLAELSDQFLAGIFGWIPFVSDIRTIVSKFENVQQDVDRFLDNADKRMTLHFQKALSPLTFQEPSYFEPRYPSFSIEAKGDASPGWFFATPIFDSIGIGYKSKRTVENLKYHATMEFSYSVPGIPPGLRRFLAELDYWGINLSISDVWQVVPFSFVVDWFLNVGAWLENFDLENLPVSVVITDYCRSIHFFYRDDVSDLHLTELTLANGESTPLSRWTLHPTFGSAVCTAESYHRWSGVPTPTADQLPNWRTPKGLQWVIGSALVTQRRRRRRRKQRR